MNVTHDEVSAEATVTAQGRLAIPKEVREAAGLGPGVKVHLTVEGDGLLRLETQAQKAHTLRARIAEQLGAAAPASLADELIADRDEEFRAEEGRP